MTSPALHHDLTSMGVEVDLRSPRRMRARPVAATCSSPMTRNARWRRTWGRRIQLRVSDINETLIAAPRSRYVEGYLFYLLRQGGISQGRQLRPRLRLQGRLVVVGHVLRRLGTVVISWISSPRRRRCCCATRPRLERPNGRQPSTVGEELIPGHFADKVAEPSFHAQVCRSSGHFLKRHRWRPHGRSRPYF